MLGCRADRYLHTPASERRPCHRAFGNAVSTVKPCDQGCSISIIHYKFLCIWTVTQSRVVYIWQCECYEISEQSMLQVTDHSANQ
jgi:hypothetical protein